nr:phage/plasmid primase, P4 family [Marseillevirus cajuinensis]
MSTEQKLTRKEILSKTVQKYHSIGLVTYPIRRKSKLPAAAKWNGRRKEDNSISEYSFPGANVGIVCGKESGVFVLDVDVQDRGMEIWEQILEEFAPDGIDTPTQQSASGGRHYFFKLTDATSEWSCQTKILSDSKGPIGIDIKTQGGGVVVYPSRVELDAGNTGKYRWLISPFRKDFAVMEESYPWLYELIAENINKKKTPEEKHTQKSSAESDEEDEQGDSAEIDELVSLLPRRLSQNRDSWIEIGMAIRAWGDDKEWLFHRFSKLCPEKYSEKVTKEQWNSFSARGASSEKRVYGKNKILDILFDSGALDYELLLQQEEGHANYWISRMKDKIRFVDESGSGYVWDEEKVLWEKCGRNLIENQHIMHVLRKFCQYALIYIGRKKKSCVEGEAVYALREKQLLDQLTKIRKQRHNSAVFKLVSTRKEVYDKNFADNLDQCPHIFPIKGKKVVDLRTGEILERKPEHMCSWECPYEAKNASDGTWCKFVLDIMGGDTKKALYIQKLCGYFMTGEASVKEFFIFWGEGNNGKSILVSLLDIIVGSYHWQLSKRAVIRTKDDSPTSGEVLRMKGKRLVTLTEVRDDWLWDEQIIKKVSGGGMDKISVRGLYKEDENFIPKCKLVIVTNPKLRLNFSDPAMVQRIRYIPFEMKFVADPNPNNPKEKLSDPRIYEKLKQHHLPDVLAWMIEGAKLFYKEGLTPPESFQECKKEFITECDHNKRFIDEMTQRNKDAKIQNIELYGVYDAWCTDNGETPVTKTKFTQILKTLGVQTKPSNSKTFYIGIQLKDKQ